MAGADGADASPTEKNERDTTKEQQALILPGYDPGKATNLLICPVSQIKNNCTSTWKE